MTSLTGHDILRAVSNEAYSAYEAKAQLSELLRKVRQGQVITITYRGEPIAEVRPVARSETALESRLQDLTERGILQRAEQSSVGLGKVAHKPGAFERFLQERE